MFVYDNFNFIDRVQGLGWGRRDTMQNLTTCLMVSSPDVRGPFTQSQWRPTATIKKDWLWSYLIPKPKCFFFFFFLSHYAFGASKGYDAAS